MKQTYTFRLETDIHAALNKKASVEWYTLSWLLSKLICEYTWLSFDNDKDWKPRYTKPTVTHTTPTIPTTREGIIDHIVETMPIIEDDTTTPAINTIQTSQHEPEQLY